MRCWISGALNVCAVVGCNSLLGIEPARLLCEQSGCDAGVVPANAALAPRDASGLPSRETQQGVDGVEGAGARASPPPPPPATSSDAGGASPRVASSPAAPPTSTESAGEAIIPAPMGPSPLGPELGLDGFALALPDDLIDAPVSGELVFSEDASWEVDGVFQPTFEIHTPTASYWVVERLGTMVSMQDGYAGRAQWIDFSSGFRPLRGVPAFAAPPVAVSTQLDAASQTPTHLRLTSTSSDGAWQWVWDFYVSHATLTVNRAPGPIGFSYRGVPAGSLGTEDQLVQSDGSAQSARSSFAGDAAGPVEWAYIADTAARRSLFLMQHTDDDLLERYQVRDNDSALWVFGDGQIARLPMRFSLGLIDSVDHDVVSGRAAYVAGVIR